MSNDPFDNEDERTTVSPMSTAPGSVPPVPSKDTRSKKSLPSPTFLLQRSFLVYCRYILGWK